MRQWTCDGSARVSVDISARQGTYNNGIGVGVVKAKILILASALARTTRGDVSKARDIHVIMSDCFVGIDPHA